MPKLSKLLIAAGILDRTQAEEALEAQTLYGGTLDTCILEFGFCDEATLEKIIPRAAGVTNHIDPRIELPTPRALSLLTAKEVERWRMIPFSARGGLLDLVGCHPVVPKVVEEIATRTRMKVRTSVTTEVRVAALMEWYYGVKRSTRLSSLARAVLSEEIHGRPLDAPTGSRLPPGDEETTRRIAESDGSQPEPAVPEETHALPPFAVASLPESAPLHIPTQAAAAAPASEHPSESPRESSQELFPVALAGLSDDPNDSDEVRQLNRQLREVSDRSQILQAPFAYLNQYVRRLALYSVRRHMCTGWDVAGQGVDRARFLKGAFSLDEPSVFQTVCEGDLYVGRLGANQVHNELATHFGPPSIGHAIVLPIQIREKVVAILLADCDSAHAVKIAFTQVVAVAEKISWALVRLILERKRG